MAKQHDQETQYARDRDRIVQFIPAEGWVAENHDGDYLPVIAGALMERVCGPGGSLLVRRRVTDPGATFIGDVVIDPGATFLGGVVIDGGGRPSVMPPAEPVFIGYATPVVEPGPSWMRDLLEGDDILERLEGDGILERLEGDGILERLELWVLHNEPACRRDMEELRRAEAAVIYASVDSDEALAALRRVIESSETFPSSDHYQRSVNPGP